MTFKEINKRLERLKKLPRKKKKALTKSGKKRKLTPMESKFVSQYIVEIILIASESFILVTALNAQINQFIDEFIPYRVIKHEMVNPLLLPVILPNNNMG